MKKTLSQVVVFCLAALISVATVGCGGGQSSSSSKPTGVDEPVVEETSEEYVEGERAINE